MIPLTILWKFPGCQTASVWTIVHVDGDLVFLSRDDRLATVSIDLAIGMATMTVNDNRGAKTRTFDAKENLCQLLESAAQQFIARGGAGDGGF